VLFQLTKTIIVVHKRVASYLRKLKRKLKSVIKEKVNMKTKSKTTGAVKKPFV